MSNSKFKNALERKVQSTPPIWFMRQAGRYHSHYQALRQKHGFMELCKNPELASEVALGPIMDFDFDVSIMFSDLLFPLEALGMGLKYEPGPKLDWQLDSNTIKNLKSPDEAVKGVDFQKDVLELTRKKLPQDKSLIGFIGGAWTLFTYACEGGHDGNMVQSKKNINLFNTYCEIILPLLEYNIDIQLKAGAEVVMIFDTSAGGLSLPVYKDLIVPTLERLSKKFPSQLGYYGKHLTEEHYKILGQLPLAGLGFDHRLQIHDCFKFSKGGFVQGNFDQALLFLKPDEFKKKLDQYLDPLLKLSAEQRSGWVCGLGHGVLPKTPEENVREFIKTIRSLF